MQVATIKDKSHTVLISDCNDKVKVESWKHDKDGYIINTHVELISQERYFQYMKKLDRMREADLYVTAKYYDCNGKEIDPRVIIY